MDPSLEKKTYAINVAAELTGQSASTAINELESLIAEAGPVNKYQKTIAISLDTQIIINDKYLSSIKSFDWEGYHTSRGEYML